MRQAEVRPFPPSTTLAVAVLTFTFATAAAQQAKKSPTSSYTGCLQGSFGESVVLSAPNFCAILKGNIADELLGHHVELMGVLAPATTASPATIQVGSVASVGDACTETCAARPQPSARPANAKLSRSKRRVSSSPMH